MVQTYDPSHYAIVSAVKQDYEGFFETESGFRKLMGYPPYVNMISVMLSSRDEGFLNEVSSRLESAIRTSFSGSRLPTETQIIGPLNAGIYKVNDIYRKILYLKHPNHDIIIRIRESVKIFVRNMDKNDRIKLQYNWE